MNLGPFFGPNSLLIWTFGSIPFLYIHDVYRCISDVYSPFFCFPRPVYQLQILHFWTCICCAEPVYQCIMLYTACFQLSETGVSAYCFVEAPETRTKMKADSIMDPNSTRCGDGVPSGLG
uniref:Uncharacterized protein n=1 Tax=Solanum tuberosum TaxID=4113 RepID=M1C3U8_SOLTU